MVMQWGSSLFLRVVRILGVILLIAVGVRCGRWGASRGIVSVKCGTEN